MRTKFAMQRNCRAGVSGLGWALALVSARVVFVASAQGIGPAKDFHLKQFYSPPHETQMKSLLDGATARQLQPDVWDVTDVKWQTFSTNGPTEVLGEAPQCICDLRQRSASSPGALQMRTGDGRFFIEGQGFIWNATNSNLTISNRVHTIIRKDLLAGQISGGPTRTPTAAENPEPIEVFSDWFNYDRDSGLAFYRGHVRVTGTNLQLAGRSLSLELPLAGVPLKNIVAEGDVVIDRGELHATGAKALYSASSDVITLIGGPVWRAGRREGRGDELVIDRTNNLFQANGHAWLKMPADSMRTSFLLNQNPASTNSPGSTNQFVEISSGSYELRTNLAVFRDQVRGAALADGRPEGKLNCGRMTIAFSGSNEVQTIVARDNVVVEQNDGHVEAESAVFFGTNSVAEFTGQPRWQSGAREGSGDLLIVDRARNEMKVRGNARVRLPAEEIRIGDMVSGASTNAAPARPSASFAEISSDDYDLQNDGGVFRGKVKAVEGSERKLICERLTWTMSSRSGEKMNRAVAEQNVVLDFADNEGTNQVTSGKAVFTYLVTNSVTNKLAEFTGSPRIRNSQGTGTGSTIRWENGVLSGITNWSGGLEKAKTGSANSGGKEALR